jgi:hypothetical protein
MYVITLHMCSTSFYILFVLRLQLAPIAAESEEKIKNWI